MISDWITVQYLRIILSRYKCNINLYLIHPTLRVFPLRLLLPTVEVVVIALSIVRASCDWTGIFQGPSSNVSSIMCPKILPVGPSVEDMSSRILFINASISFVDGRVSNPTCEPRNMVCSNSSSSSNFRISARKFLMIFSTIAT